MKMFYLGILTTLSIIGALFFIYNYLLIRNSKKQLKNRLKNDFNKVKIKEEVNNIIHEARKKALLENKETTFLGNLEKFKEISLDTARHISKKYNPDSNYPEYELTFYELLRLNSEITNYLLDALETKSEIKYLKDIKVCHLIGAKDIKGKFDKIVDHHNSKIETGKNIYNITSFCLDPINKIQNNVISKFFEKSGKILLETSIKSILVFGVTKAGLELEKIYSGHYLKKDVIKKK